MYRMVKSASIFGGNMFEKFSISFTRKEEYRPYHPTFAGSGSGQEDLDKRVYNARPGSAHAGPTVVIVEVADLQDAYRLAGKLDSSFSAPIVMPYMGDKPALSEEEFLGRYSRQAAPA